MARIVLHSLLPFMRVGSAEGDGLSCLGPISCVCRPCRRLQRDQRSKRAVPNVVLRRIMLQYNDLDFILLFKGFLGWLLLKVHWLGLPKIVEPYHILQCTPASTFKILKR